jgi:spore germination protein YaaH
MKRRKKIKIIAGIVVIASLLIIGLLINNRSRKVTKQGSNEPAQKSILRVPNNVLINKKSIFMPYWNIENFENGNWDNLYYFGVNVNTNGIDKNETGYAKLEQFQNITNGKKSSLVLRMTDSETVFSLLKNKKKINKIINESIDIVNKYKFDGIALDLEISMILSEDTKAQINNFVKDFYTQAKNNNLKFTYILYGDVFYRMRGYDIKTIAANCDEIMIMAYDFHKSRGTPGPNFPLGNRAKYGYDFKLMIEDFLHFVPAEKISVIFGMYGYDWQVDAKKLPIKPARALTLKEIQKSFLEKCAWKDCVIRRDSLSAETEINYVVSTKGDDGSYLEYHMLWFEDEESAAKKIEYLKTKGIGSVAYWAYDYF